MEKDGTFNAQALTQAPGGMAWFMDAPDKGDDAGESEPLDAETETVLPPEALLGFGVPGAFAFAASAIGRTGAPGWGPPRPPPAPRAARCIRKDGRCGASTAPAPRRGLLLVAARASSFTSSVWSCVTSSVWRGLGDGFPGGLEAQDSCPTPIVPPPQGNCRPGEAQLRPAAARRCSQCLSTEQRGRCICVHVLDVVLALVLGDLGLHHRQVVPRQRLRLVPPP